MKECEQKRNLAFYKRSGKPWTPEQYKAICQYCNANEFPLFGIDNVSKKYIFDHGEDSHTFMCTWYRQISHYNFKNCKQIAYEDIFNEDGTVKGEQMEEVIAIDIYKWFDVKNEEHIKAYIHLQEKGFWPEGFVPDYVTRDNLWHVRLAGKLADAYIQDFIDEIKAKENQDV